MAAHSWNVNRNGDTYDVRVKWINWSGGNGWRPIVTAIQGDRTVSEMPSLVQFPLTAQGTTEIEADGRFSMTRHIGEGNGTNSEPGLSCSVEVLAETNVTGHQDPADPSRWIYPEAWPGADLIWEVEHGRAVRLKKTVQIDPTRVSAGSLSYQFVVRSGALNQYFTGPMGGIRRPLWLGGVRSTDTESEGVFLAKGDSELRGVTIKPALAWYLEAGERVTVPVKLRSLEISPGVVEITKLIPASVVLAARQAGSMLWTDATFYPDPDPETSSVDGRFYRFIDEGTWNDLSTTGPAQAALSNEASMSTNLIKSDDLLDTWNILSRYGFLFNTSSLSGAVASATLSVSSSGCTSNFAPDSDVSLYSMAPASNTSFVVGDWTTFSDIAISNTQGQPISSGFTDWTLTDLTKVDINGITKLGIRSVADATNTAPTWASATSEIWSSMLFSETTGTTKDPKLVVTTVPVTTTTDEPTTTTSIPTTTTDEPAGPSSLIPETMTQGDLSMATDNANKDDNGDIHVFGSKVLRAVIDSAASGDVTIVSAVAGKRIRLISSEFKASGAVSVKWTSGAAGTTISGAKSLIDGSGEGLGMNPAGWFETAAGDALVLNKTAAVQTGGSILYVLV